MNNKILSILIPTWNRVEAVIKAIKSVGQENQDFVEIIVVDNHSPKNIYDELQKELSIYKNVKLYRNESNIGMVKNWNKCIEYSTGEWLSLMCSDDEYVTGAITIILNLLRQYSEPFLLIQDPSIKNELEQHKAGYETAKSLKLPIASGNIWHRSITEKLGGFNTRIKYSPDAEFWVRIAYSYSVIKIKSPIAIYHETNSNYMWETWEKDDFLEQVELISTIINSHDPTLTKQQKKINIDVSVTQTILTILFKTIQEKERIKIFRKYFFLFIKKNLTPHKWFVFFKSLYVLAKTFKHTKRKLLF